MPSLIPVYQLSSGSWLNILSAGKIDVPNNAEPAARAFYVKISGAWVLCTDFSTPSAAPGGGSITTDSSGPFGAAVVSWGGTTNQASSVYFFNVQIDWYQNGVLAQTNTVQQSAGSNRSPSSFNPGDIAHAVIRYVNVNGHAGSTWTSGNVTIPDGIEQT